MKRTFNLPSHFEGTIHINIGDTPVKVSITKTGEKNFIDGIQGNDTRCKPKCVKKNPAGECIDWITVCHE